MSIPQFFSNNEILVLAPYHDSGCWMFDDPSVGLQREPFVAGMTELIDDLVADIPDARGGFCLQFSSSPFPGYQRQLRRLHEAWEGHWYGVVEGPRTVDDHGEIEGVTTGWLCPALFRYFETAPDRLYVAAKPIS